MLVKNFYLINSNVILCSKTLDLQWSTMCRQQYPLTNFLWKTIVSAVFQLQVLKRDRQLILQLVCACMRIVSCSFVYCHIIIPKTGFFLLCFYSLHFNVTKLFFSCSFLCPLPFQKKRKFSFLNLRHFLFSWYIIQGYIDLAELIFCSFQKY